MQDDLELKHSHLALSTIVGNLNYDCPPTCKIENFEIINYKLFVTPDDVIFLPVQFSDHYKYYSYRLSRYHILSNLMEHILLV